MDEDDRAEWDAKPMTAWMAGYRAALESVKAKVIEYGADGNGNIPIRVVFEAINAS